MRRPLLALVLLLSAACSQEIQGPQPTLGDDPEVNLTDPGLLCQDEPGQWVTLRGEGFSPLLVGAAAGQPTTELPSVTVTRRTDPLGDPVDQVSRATLRSTPGEEGGALRWIDDQTLRFFISEELDLLPGVYDLRVENPGGESATAAAAFGILPRPTLDETSRPLSCLSQEDRPVTITGQNLLIGDGISPEITVDGEVLPVESQDRCRPLHPVFGPMSLCREITVAIPRDALPPGDYPLAVNNRGPGQCPGYPDAEPATLSVVSAPTLNELVPDLVCRDHGRTEVVRLKGTHFLTVGDARPTVVVGHRTYEARQISGCEPLDEARPGAASRCTELTVMIADGDLADAIDDENWIENFNVTVNNPDAVGCATEEDHTLSLAAAPQVTSIAPRNICSHDDEVVLDITGQNFFSVDGDTPTARIGTRDYPTSLDDCQGSNDQQDLQACTSLTVTIAPSHLSGIHHLTVTNPAPLACHGAASPVFYASSGPRIDTADPTGFCEDAEFDGNLEIFGQFLDQIDGEPLQVAIEGEPVPFEIHECALVDDELPLQICGRITPIIPAEMLDGLDEEQFTVTVTDPLACGEASFTLFRTDPPTLESISPHRACADGGTTFEVRGHQLHPAARYYLNGQPAADADIDFIDETLAYVTFAHPIDDDTATVEVINPGDCGDLLAEPTIEVIPAAEALYVDPPVISDRAATEVIVYAAPLMGAQVDGLELIAPDGTTTLVEVELLEEQPSPQFRAIIPAGLLGEIEGTTEEFELRLVESEIQCGRSVAGLIKITDDQALPLVSVTPDLGYQGELTPVEVRASTPDGQAGEVTFKPGARAYLSPSGDAYATQIELVAVGYRSALELEASVPLGLAPGGYDLIVINPDGAMGTLPDAFTVTADRLPRISSTTPDRW